jgi:nitrite reductase/ring-hydroxylating ferredoxin subunit
MVTATENETLTRVGPGTPMGNVLRRYWQPVLLTEELPAARPVKESRILGEDIVVFRNEQGRYGALARHCAHRSGDLAFGRLENGGLRCPYHGWLYDITGRCLDQPAAPAEYRFHDKIRQTAYPCVERNGIIYGYLGPGEPPLFPEFDWHLAPASHTFAYKGYQRANWLQSVEGEIDPSHLSFLHRYLTDQSDTEESYGFNQFLAAADATEISVTKLLRDIPNPKLEVEKTEFGVRIFALRDAGNFMHVRVTNFLFPNAAVVAIGDRTLVQLHVPIDDYSNWRFDIFCRFETPMDKHVLLRERLKTYDDYKPRRNMENRYGFSAEEQKTGTYLGVGYDFNIHDTVILEGAGAIQDRTKENLGYTDKGIVAARQMLLKAAGEADNGALPMLTRDPAANRFDNLVTIETVTAHDAWRTGWVDRQLKRRADSPWAARIPAAKLKNGLTPGR